MELENIIHRCFRCGYCKFPSNYADFNCPSYFSYRFETYSPGGRMWLIREWLSGGIESTKRFQEIIYSCATCYNCVLNCAMVDFRDQILDIFRETKEILIDKGKVPLHVKSYLENVYKFKNGFGINNKKRFNWAVDLPDFDATSHEYLLYVGDEACFDDVAQDMALSTTKLFEKMGISFGILRKGEISDGLEAYNLGETELFKEIGNSLVKSFKHARAKRIVTLSPHSFYAFKTIYPKFFDVDFKVYHYTQLIEKKLHNFKTEIKETKKISYHDPCYLARYLKDSTTVRNIFFRMGLSIVEPIRNRENTLCCGGGGGNFYTSLTQKGPDNTSKERLREISKLGVNTLITVCPICLAMLIDAKRSFVGKVNLEILDLSSFLLRHL